MIWATRGGVTLGLCLLAHYMIKWWPGLAAFRGKKVTVRHRVELIGRLLPFAYGWAYGALGILTVMGLIAWCFDTALWAANWVGDAVGLLGVGETPGQVSKGVTVALTSDGNWMVLILTAATVALVKFRPSGPDIKLGVLCGLCLGTSAGISGLMAVPLAQGVNALGSAVFGAVG
jgi:hypothetical protein